jgi:hypothetical protein
VLILGGAGTGGQESLRLRRQGRNPPLLTPPKKKGRVPRRIHAPARLTQAQHPQLQV